MTTRELLGVVMAVGVLAACDAGTTATAKSCAASSVAIVRAFTLTRPTADRAAIEGPVAKRCTDDHWSDQARRCLAAAKTRDGVRDCSYKHLTQQQQDNLNYVAGAVTVSEAVEAMERFTDQMCACKVSTCAQKVADEMTRWSEEYSKREPPKMTERETRQAAQIGERMGKCMQAAMMPPSFSVTPAKGDAAGGEDVTIQGYGFIRDGARTPKVYFGERQATSVRFATDEELIVKTPSGKPGEIVDVKVEFEPGGTQQAHEAFTYEATP